MALRQIEMVVTSLASGELTKTLTLATPLLDTSKAAMFVTLRTPSASATQTQISWEIISTTQITFTRQGSGSVCDIVAYVIEWTSGVLVERGTAAQLGNITDVTLTSITDLSKAFYTLSYEIGGGTYSNNDQLLGRLWDDAGTLKLRLEVSGGGGGSRPMKWQVIQYDACAVQRGSLSMTGVETSKAATLSPAVDLGKTFCTVSRRSADTTGTTANIASRMFRGRLTSAAQITVDRGNAGGLVMDEISWEAVEFTDDVLVEAVAASFAASETAKNFTVAAGTAKAVIASGQHSQAMGRCDYTANDIPGETLVTGELTTPTNLAVTRASSIAAAAAELYAIDFGNVAAPGASAAPPFYLANQ